MTPLRTDRLALRPFTMEDAPFVLRQLNEPSFLRQIGDKEVRTLEQARAYLQSGPMASYLAHGHGLGAVVLSATGQTMGMCGLLKRDYFQDPDLGYAFLPEFWGKGYALEAAEAVLSHAWKRLGLARVLATVTPTNDPSIRLLRKLGFGFSKLMRTDPAEDEVAVYELDRTVPLR
jgi:RimJ/RimL family protein N-acetyltransferase